MKPLAGALITILATCGDRVNFDVDAGTIDAGATDAGTMCEGGCIGADLCIPLASNTTVACGGNGGVCIDCSSSVLHASLPSCNLGACDFFACETGWSSCDAIRANGCERHVSACYEVLAENQGPAWLLETDGTDLYWMAQEGIRTMPVGGGIPAYVASGTIQAFALSGANIFFATDTTLSVVPKAGGVPVVLANLSGSVTELVTDGATVFWTQNGDLKSTPAGGGQVSLLLGGVASAIRNLALIDADVWFTVNGDVMKLPQAGGTATRAATLPHENVNPD